MRNLIALLLAQLDEIEQAAKRALGGVERPWIVQHGDIVKPTSGPETFVIANRVQEWYSGHIVRHDPISVLTDVAAKRQIIAACSPDHLASLANGDDSTELATEVLRLLAAGLPASQFAAPGSGVSSPEPAPAAWVPKPGDLVTGRSRLIWENDPVGEYVGQVRDTARIKVPVGPGAMSPYRYVDVDTLRPVSPAVPEDPATPTGADQ